MMRIAYICADPGIPVFGNKGASIHVQEIIRAFRRIGAQVELFAARIGGSAPAGLEDIAVYKLAHLTPPNNTAHRENMALAANSQLGLMLQAQGPFDLVYERYSLWSYVGMEYAQGAGIPGVLEVNAPLIEEQLAYRKLVARREAEQVAARAFNSASVLIAVSREVADYLTTFTTSHNRVFVIPNGVDPRRFSSTVAPFEPRRANEFVVGFVGSLKPWHDIHTLVEAFALLHQAHPNARLLIVGDGPLRGEILTQLDQHNLRPFAHLTGAVAHEAVPGWIMSMDVAVAPYRRLDNFYFSPLKLFEYMAAGRAIIASDVGQIRSVITAGETGLLCDPGDAQSLAGALESMLAKPALRQALGEAARQWIGREHTWDSIAQRVLTYAALGFGQAGVG